MPDNTQTNDAIPQIPAVDDTTSVTPASDSAAADNLSSDLPLPPAPTTEQDGDIPSVIPEVVRRINESHNILVALSSDPSVDEMSAAIGITWTVFIVLFAAAIGVIGLLFLGFALTRKRLTILLCSSRW